MRTKTESVSIIMVIISAVVLIAGCKGIPSGEKCQLDADCGGDYCSEDFRKAVSPACVEGKCQGITTACDETEICVADSRGVRCLPKDPNTNKAILSCSSNTINPSLNPFNPAGYVCKDDCAADSFCNESCICEEKEILSCSENTEDFEDYGLSLFDQRTNICADDCPPGLGCIVGCVCEEYVCPDSVFTNDYFDPPPIDVSFPELLDMWMEDPGILFDHIGDTINISAYEHRRGSGSYIIPFPEVQLSIIPNPNNDYIEQYGAYCVNDYYEGDEALDIDYQWLTRPEQTCIWGGTTGFNGVLTICTERLIDWFEVYTEP